MYLFKVFAHKLSIHLALIINEPQLYIVTNAIMWQHFPSISTFFKNSLLGLKKNVIKKLSLIFFLVEGLKKSPLF